MAWGVLAAVGQKLLEERDKKIAQQNAIDRRPTGYFGTPIGSAVTPQSPGAGGQILGMLGRAGASYLDNPENQEISPEVQSAANQAKQQPLEPWDVYKMTQGGAAPGAAPMKAEAPQDLQAMGPTPARQEDQNPYGAGLTAAILHLQEQARYQPGGYAGLSNPDLQIPQSVDYGPELGQAQFSDLRGPARMEAVQQANPQAFAFLNGAPPPMQSGMIQQGPPAQAPMPQYQPPPAMAAQPVGQPGGAPPIMTAVPPPAPQAPAAPAPGAQGFQSIFQQSAATIPKPPDYQEFMAKHSMPSIQQVFGNRPITRGELRDYTVASQAVNQEAQTAWAALHQQYADEVSVAQGRVAAQAGLEESQFIADKLGVPLSKIANLPENTRAMLRSQLNESQKAEFEQQKATDLAKSQMILEHVKAGYAYTLEVLKQTNDNMRKGMDFESANIKAKNKVAEDDKKYAELANTDGWYLSKGHRPEKKEIEEWRKSNDVVTRLKTDVNKLTVLLQDPIILKQSGKGGEVEALYADLMDAKRFKEKYGVVRPAELQWMNKTLPDPLDFHQQVMKGIGFEGIQHGLKQVSQNAEDSLLNNHLGFYPHMVDVLTPDGLHMQMRSDEARVYRNKPRYKITDITPPPNYDAEAPEPPSMEEMKQKYGHVVKP